MFRLLIAIMLTASIIRFASAEGYYARIYGGFTDVSFSESYGNNNANRVKSNDNAPYFGIAVGNYINEDFSAELAVERLEADFETTGGVIATGTAEATALFLNGFYHFNDTVYAGLGIGIGEFKFKDITGAANDADKRAFANTIETRLPYQAIIGFKIPLTDNLDWDTNFRHLIIDSVGISSVSTGLRFNF